MRSKELALDQYDTDKITNRYLERYDPMLKHLVDREIKLLEVGVWRGGSLRLWRDYFPNGTIVGIDLNVPDGLANEDRIQAFRGSQTDTAFLSDVARKTAPAGFDVIIDDASHMGDLTRTTFWHLFDNHLKPSGLYVIEDWGTGYWDDWPDGKSFRPRSRIRTTWLRWLGKLGLATKTPSHNHNYGLVGFIKELVDEQCAADLTRARQSSQPQRCSKFDSMVITPSIVFINKRST